MHIHMTILQNYNKFTVKLTLYKLLLTIFINYYQKIKYYLLYL